MPRPRNKADLLKAGAEYYAKLIETADDYLKFLQNELRFAEARNQRIATLTVRDIII